jgi:hypothetical protein
MGYLSKQQQYRKNTNYSVTKKYEKTLMGKLVRTYRNMYTRVSGILKTKQHLYMGLEILSREDFYKWSLENKDYMALHKDWVDSGYDRKLSPSIDRINVSKGYVLENIRWVTHAENSRLGSVSRWG